MGIANCNKLFENINLRGLYNGGNWPKASNGRINLYVDGENIRFKGMTNSNVESDNAERRIAQDAFAYLDRIRQRLTTHLFRRRYVDSGATSAHRTKRDFDKVYVYMDGRRPHNKVTRIVNVTVDHSIIRNALMDICRMHAPLYEVVLLEYGESELFMYADRDKAAALNIFVTTDSDCLSIMYGHVPVVEYSDGSLRNNVDDDSSDSSGDAATHFCENYARYTRKSDEQMYFDRLERSYKNNEIPSALLQDTSRDFSLMHIVDLNDSYDIGNGDDDDKPIRSVRDSCVFAHISQRSLYLYSMDFLQQRLRLPRKLFRVFCALSGTDFTRPLLSATLMENFIRNIAMPESTRVRRDIAFLAEHTKHETDVCVLFVLLSALHGADANKCKLPLRLGTRQRGHNTNASSNRVDVDEDDIALYNAVDSNALMMRDYHVNVVETKTFDEVLSELVLACDTYLAYIASGVMPDVNIPNVCSAGDYLLKLVNGLRRRITPHYRIRSTRKRKSSSVGSFDDDELIKLKDICCWCNMYPDLLRMYHNNKQNEATMEKTRSSRNDVVVQLMQQQQPEVDVDEKRSKRERDNDDDDDDSSDEKHTTDQQDAALAFLATTRRENHSIYANRDNNVKIDDDDDDAIADVLFSLQ